MAINNVQGCQLAQFSVGDVVSILLIVGSVNTTANTATGVVDAPLPTDIQNVNLTVNLFNMTPPIAPCNPVAAGQYILVEGYVTSIAGSSASSAIGLTILSGNTPLTVSASQIQCGSNFLNEL